MLGKERCAMPSLSPQKACTILRNSLLPPSTFPDDVFCLFLYLSWFANYLHPLFQSAISSAIVYSVDITSSWTHYYAKWVGTPPASIMALIAQDNSWGLFGTVLRNSHVAGRGLIFHSIPIQFGGRPLFALWTSPSVPKRNRYVQFISGTSESWSERKRWCPSPSPLQHHGVE